MRHRAIFFVSYSHVSTVSLCVYVQCSERILGEKFQATFPTWKQRKWEKKGRRKGRKWLERKRDFFTSSNARGHKEKEHEIPVQEKKKSLKIVVSFSSSRDFSCLFPPTNSSWRVVTSLLTSLSLFLLPPSKPFSLSLFSYAWVLSFSSSLV